MRFTSDVAPNPWLRVARLWLALGVFGVAFLGAVAFSVFVDGVRVRDRNSGAVLPRTEVVTILVPMALGFVFFAAVGLS
jgi:hypothetical protein